MPVYVHAVIQVLPQFLLFQNTYQFSHWHETIKVKIGSDQEISQLERHSHSKNRGGKN